MFPVTKAQLIALFASYLSAARATVNLTTTTADDAIVAKLEGWWAMIQPFLGPQSQPLFASAPVELSTEASAELSEIVAMPTFGSRGGLVGANGQYLAMLLSVLEKLAPILLPLLVADQPPVADEAATSGDSEDDSDL